MADLMNMCKDVLAEIIALPEAEAFLEPVPWKEWGLDDYPRIIKQPMDLGTVNTHMINGDYKDAYEFAYDMRLIWRNCCTYNQEGADIYTTGKKLSDIFEEKFKQIEAKVPEDDREPDLTKKRAFVDMLFHLSPSDLSKVIQVLNERCESSLDKTNADLVDIIVDAIDNSTFHYVYNFAEKCLHAEQPQTTEQPQAVVQSQPQVVEQSQPQSTEGQGMEIEN